MTRRHHRSHHEHHEYPHYSGSGQDGKSDNGSNDKSSSDSKDVYGVWKGTVTSYKAQTLEQDRSPHITLNFSTSPGSNSSSDFQAQINVASTTTDTQLVYWTTRNWTHPLTSTLTPLPAGFSEAQTTDGTGLSLDFLRTKPALVDFSAGQLVQDSNASDTSTDILDDLVPMVKDAIAGKADVYIFGRDYGTGIDDVHMNQGNTGDYENAVGRDGALLFHYANTGKWDTVFLAFATQEVPTNNETGAPEAGAKALDTIAKGAAT